MPNHCENDLYVTGPELEVKRFMTFIGADKDTPAFDCNAVIPYPEKFKQMDEEAKAFSFFNNEGSAEEREAAKKVYEAKWGTAQDGYNSGGYEWCVSNWGTKWGAYEVEVYEHPKRGTCITFQSAWSPPTPVIRKLFELFPTLHFEHEYFECGAGYCGAITYNPEARQYDEDPVSEWHTDDYTGNRGG
jgi:hypothetical protein